jgi:hypothetical protein
MSAAGKTRVASDFGVEKMVDSYEQTLTQVIGTTRVV